MEAKNEHLKQQAKMVLDFNDSGEYTKPSPRLYPHQWSWDSAFIALGYATYDTGRARRELASLFAGQWSNGLLPHIIFNPELNNYFPGSRVWRTGESPDAPSGRRTSGVVQPPAHAIATLRAYRRGKLSCPHAMGLWLSQLAAWLAANPPPPVERMPEQYR